MDPHNLGQIIVHEAARDAVHMAIAPVVAAKLLAHGEHVGLDENGQATHSNNPIGVVDPFLRGPVDKGETFWLFLYPGTITGLRHEWAHPAFKELPIHVGDKAASESWLREFCEMADCPGYEAVMQGIQGHFEEVDPIYGGGGTINGSYLHFQGKDAHGDIPREFWEHAEIVLGKKLPHHPEMFSCSC